MVCDVLIIGGGLAGMMAARETLSKNLRTVMIRDGFGASPWVHGFNHPVRSGDSAKVFFDDVMKSGQGLCDPALVGALCGDSAVIFDELKALGLEFNRDPQGNYQAIRPLGAAFPRVISIGNETGTAILKKLEALTSPALTVLSPARALRLITEKKKVTGALVYLRDQRTFVPVFAKAVILAAGGFCGIWPLSTNKHDSGGDACAMAFEAGAELTDMEFIQFEPSASVWPPSLNGTSMITTLFYEGAVLRNNKGERFMAKKSDNAERVGKDVLARSIAEEIRSGGGTEHGGVYMDVTKVDPGVLDRDYPMYVKRYLDAGIDLKTQWIELAPAPHTSLGGIRTDENCFTTLEGLFACGENMGGLHGANRVGGNGGLEALVFGRRAGKSAAAFAPDADAPTEKDVPLPGKGIRPVSEAIREERGAMAQILKEDAGVIRCGRDLESGLKRLKEIRDEADTLQGADPEESFHLMRLKNDLTSAEMVLASAGERTETVGCHVRSDFPCRDTANYRILLSKRGTGIHIERTDLS